MILEANHISYTYRTQKNIPVVAFRVKCKNFSHKLQKGRLKGILFPLKRPFGTHFLGS